MIYSDSYLYDSKLGDWFSHYNNVNKILDLKTDEIIKVCDWGFAKFANGRVYYVDYKKGALYRCECDGSDRRIITNMKGAREVIYADNYAMYVLTDNGIYNVDLETERVSLFLQ